MKKLLALILISALLMADAVAAVCVRMQDKAVLLTDEGTEVELAYQYEDIVPVGNGYLAAKRGAYALMNESGVELTRPVYSQLRIAEDMILAEKNGFWGLLSNDGAPLCEFEYTWILPTGAGSCWALRGEPNDNESDELLLLDTAGLETQTGLFVRRFSRHAEGGLLAVQPSGYVHFGYCNARGELVVPAQYDYAGTFAGGLAPAAKDGKYGVIASDGSIIIPFEYDFIELSEGGGRVVAKDAQGVYLFDASGERIAAHAGAGLQIGFAGERCVIYDGGSVQIFDADGKLLHTLPAGTAVAQGVDGQLVFSDGAWGEYCVYLEGTQEKYQHLYPLGKINGAPIYACMQVNTARYMNDLLGEIQLSTDMDSARWGAVDAEGKLLLDCVYESIEIAGDGCLLVQRDGQWQLIEPDGTLRWESPMPEEAASSEAGS